MHVLFPALILYIKNRLKLGFLIYTSKIVILCFILLLVFWQKLRVNSDNQQADNFYALSDYNRAINESEERNDEI